MRVRVVAVFVACLLIYQANGRPHLEIDCVPAPYAAWALVRAVLAGALGCPPAAVPIDRRCGTCGQPGHGKPRVAGDGPEFSLSHAGDGVLLAVHPSAPVGVDLEVAGRNVDQIGPMIAGPGELQAFGPALVHRLDSAPRQARLSSPMLYDDRSSPSISTRFSRCRASACRAFS